MADIYPGYTWSISQHMGPASDSLTMFKLLQCAYKYSTAPNFQDLISHEMTSMGLLTANVRQNRPQPWRDYQQVLPELGLIVSTKLTRNTILLTPIGYQWLDGAIGYSELLTSQCLNYQYPNGYKTDISSSLKAELLRNKIIVPETRTELDANYGVLLRPALLILRILLHLHKRNKAPEISPMQCLVHLVPIKRNKNWINAYESLISSPGKAISDQRRLRHIQEWYRVLSYTEIFKLSEGKLSLSDYALSILSDLESYCSMLEEESTFWIPTDFNINSVKQDWFNYFGNIPIEYQWLRNIDDMSNDYIVKNYCEGIEDVESEDAMRSWSHAINLREFEFGQQNNRKIGNYSVNNESILQGKIKTQKRSILHEEIVENVATKLISCGYSVFEDKNSVDILAIKGQQHAIIEVKTITNRNAASRLRLGIGQLAEYRYRRHLSGHPRPSAVLVCSAEARYPDWFADFFSSDLKMGLASMKNTNNFLSYTGGEIESILAS